MSSGERTAFPAPVIPNGVYRFKLGSNSGSVGLYLTAGRPGAQATAAPLRLIPKDPRRIQRFVVTYDHRTGSYLLRSDPQHGLSYRQPSPGQAIITSIGAPREFTITKVRAAEAGEAERAGDELYNIGVGGGSTRLLGIGPGPQKISPPLLQFHVAGEGTLWQAIRIAIQEGGEEEEEVDDEEEDAHSDE